MVRRVSAALSVLAAVVMVGLLGSPGTDARSASFVTQPSRLLGFVDGKLVRVDAEALRALPGQGIPVGSGGCASRQGGTACWTIPPWTISPDSTQLALARNDASSLRFVDVSRMRVTANVHLPGGPVGALAWLMGGRILAVQEAAAEGQQLVAVDLAARRVVSRRVLGGSVVQLARTARELVLLLAPADAIGQARLAIADRRGAVRFVRLQRILAGSKLLGTGSAHRADIRSPGLAVDPQRRRAFIVDKGLVAEIDLRSLATGYHTLARPAALLEPVAQEKQVEGHMRSARWLGGHRLVVSGTETEATRTRPVGLLFVDTRNWNVRNVEPEATTFVVAGNLVLATGATNTTTAIGVAAYGRDGERRFRLFDDETSWVANVFGGRAYVGGSGNGPLRVVDLATGRVVGERRQPPPWLVQGIASGWWG